MGYPITKFLYQVKIVPSTLLQQKDLKITMCNDQSWSLNAGFTATLLLQNQSL